MIAQPQISSQSLQARSVSSAIVSRFPAASLVLTFRFQYMLGEEALMPVG